MHQKQLRYVCAFASIGPQFSTRLSSAKFWVVSHGAVPGFWSGQARHWKLPGIHDRPTLYLGSWTPIPGRWKPFQTPQAAEIHGPRRKISWNAWRMTCAAATRSRLISPGGPEVMGFLGWLITWLHGGYRIHPSSIHSDMLEVSWNGGYP